MAMTDEEYKEKWTVLYRARSYELSVLEEAVERKEVYTLHASFHGSSVVWPFLWLEDAISMAEDDCAAEYIMSPEGIKLDPFTGEKLPDE